MAKAKQTIPDGYHTITPMLTLEHAAQTIEWYKEAFGAKELGRAVGPDGKVWHAELQIGTSRFMVHDAMMGGKSAKALGGSPASLWLYVDDVDKSFARAIAAGATVPPGPMSEVSDQFWGDRCGMVSDPEGYIWTIATHVEDVSHEELDRRMKQFAEQPANP